MNLTSSPEGTGHRQPLVLLVDPVVASRHCMWRALNRAFGVLEASDMAGADAWLSARRDIDALVVKDDLPDGRGLDFVRGISAARHPAAARAIVLTRLARSAHGLLDGGPTLLDPSDLRAALAKIVAWFLDVQAGPAKAVLRAAERLSA